MKKHRIAIAKQHVHWTPEQGKKVMEVTFKCFIWSDRFDPKLKVPTVKHPDLVMVWITFSGEMGRPTAGFYFLPKKQMAKYE